MSNLNWRLPTKEELNKMYENLHKKEIGRFADYYYWSSEGSSYNAWVQNFGNGLPSTASKYGTFRVRAVRAFNQFSANRHYKVGQAFPDGIVFDIQDDKVYVCKKEDEKDLYTWDEAMKLFEGKEEKQMEQNKKWYKWMLVSVAGSWCKRAVVELFDGGSCRFIINAEDESYTNFKRFIDNKSYDYSSSDYCREIVEPEYKPYEKITSELKERLLKDKYLLDGTWTVSIERFNEVGDLVQVDGDLYSLKELFDRFKFLDSSVIGELK